jgi:hypothetical protein
MVTEINEAREVKSLIRRSELFNYQVAAQMGISVPTLTIWFRNLDKEKAGRIREAVKELTQQRGAAS